MDDFIKKFYDDVKFNYIFNDNVELGTCRTPQIKYENKIKKIMALDNDEETLLTEKDQSELSKLGGLPSTINLRNYSTKIYDQSALDVALACAVSSAISIRTKYINSNRWGGLAQYIVGNKFTQIDPSVLYLNWNSKVECGISSISSIPTMMRILEDYKCPDNKLWEFEPENYNTLPTLRAFSYAYKSPKFTTFKLQSNLFSIKAALYMGYPVVCGVVLFNSSCNHASYQFGTIKHPTVDKDDSINEHVKGGHVILLIGYDDVKKIFYFQNSLGTKWGDDGYGTIEYSFIGNKKIAGDFWCVTYEGW